MGINIFLFPSLSGVKQSGVELGDVVLPPWAKGDPKEFIRQHREVTSVLNSVDRFANILWFDNINRTLGYQVEICHFVQLFVSFFQDWTLANKVQNSFVECLIKFHNMLSLNNMQNDLTQFYF